MSSSSDSENKLANKILEAADLKLLTDSLYVSNFVNSTGDEESYKVDRKSQRYLNYDEYRDTCLKIPQSMQIYIYNKLSALIGSSTDFIDIQTNIVQRGNNNKWKSRIRLLHDSEVFVDDINEDDRVVVNFHKKLEVNRRSVDTEALSVVEKIEASTISHSEILLGSETKSWVNRKKGRVFTYRKNKTGSTFHLIDANKEFSRLRKKNCWSEKYISTKKFFQKSLIEILSTKNVTV